MCIALPMRVLESDDTTAWVGGRNEKRRVSMMLVGAQPVGTPLLVHTDVALRVLSEEEVPLLEAALDGLEVAMQGGNTDEHFADLINREPQLPPHLRPGGR